MRMKKLLSALLLAALLATLGPVSLAETILDTDAAPDLEYEAGDTSENVDPDVLEEPDFDLTDMTEDGDLPGDPDGDGLDGDTAVLASPADDDTTGLEGTGLTLDDEDPDDDGTDDDTPDADPAPIIDSEPIVSPELVAYPSGGLSNDDAIAGYINQQMYAQPVLRSSKKRAALNLGGRFGNTPEGRLYDALKPRIESVAAGDLSSTVFYVPLNTIYDDTAYTAQDLGLSTLTYEGEVSVAAVYAFWSKVTPDLNRVLDALMFDCPYELYWYDKTYGTYYCNPPYECDGNTIRIKGLNDSGNQTYFKFTVAKEYSVSGNTGTFKFDTSKAEAVRNAADNARQIVSAHAAEDDLTKLYSYKNEICGLVDYNDDAVGGETAYGNPWQLVWVFDGDPDTKVVCEGYSKAFQYLCDMSSFSGNVSTLTVTGIMGNDRGNSGLHMWNVINFGGISYIADLTNCDDGTIGYPDLLFLKGYSYCEVELYATVYNFEIGSWRLYYVFDDDSIKLYSAAELDLSEDPVGLSSDEVPSGNFGENGALHWKMNASGVLYISGSGAIPDNTDANPLPWFASDALRLGVKKVTISNGVTGMGDRAFCNCENLTQISIPESLTDFGEDVFTGCHMYAEGSRGIIMRSCKNKSARAYAESLLEAGIAVYSLTHRHIQIDSAVAATCTSTGLTQGHHCLDCDDILEPQQIVPLKAHSPVTDAAVAPTCASAGKTAGSHCSECGTVFVAQEPIPATGNHTWGGWETAKAPACTTAGTERRACAVCGQTQTRAVAATGHTPATVKGKAATCAATGLTDGTKCSVCGEWITKQQTIAKKAHTPATVKGYAATCTATGLTDGTKCSVCGAWIKKQQTIAKVAHNPVRIVPGYAATFAKNGLTDGEMCATCEKWIKPRKTIAHLIYSGSVLKKNGKNPTITAYIGTPFRLTPQFATNAKATVRKYNSSKPKFAGVSSSGLVTPKKPGTTTITVTTGKNKVKATVTIKVVAPPPTGISITNKGPLSIRKGKTVKLKTSMTPKYAASKLTWTSSDRSIATVDKNGKVKAGKKTGTATITVTTANGESAKIRIKVK